MSNRSGIFIGELFIFKEQRILRLQEEVRRLALYESECTRKEELVQVIDLSLVSIMRISIIWIRYNIEYEK